MALGYARNQHDGFAGALGFRQATFPSAVPGDLPVLNRVFLRRSQGYGPKEYGRDQ